MIIADNESRIRTTSAYVAYQRTTEDAASASTTAEQTGTHPGTAATTSGTGTSTAVGLASTAGAGTNPLPTWAVMLGLGLVGANL